MRAAPINRSLRSAVATAVLLAGLAAVFVGFPQVAVSAGTRVAVPSGWIIGTPPADGYGVILHTIDGGQLWARQGSTIDIPNVVLNNVKAVDSDTAWVVGYSDSGYGVVLRTSDAGQTWVRRGGPGTIPDQPIFGVRPMDRQTAWVVGGHGSILRTRDGGQTWTHQVSGTAATLREVAAVDAQTAWAVGDAANGYGVILHTTDGGKTWKRQGTAATIQDRNFVDLTVVDARTAFRSADTEGNVEATQSCTVRIDGLPPTVVDIGSVVAWHGDTARFVYRLGDPAVTSLRARLVITRYGRLVACVDLGRRPTGRRLTAALRCVWQTSLYRWRVTATDPTGQRAVGTAHTLRVLPNRDRPNRQWRSPAQAR